MSHKRAVEYVKEQLRAGHSPDSVKAALEQADWDESEIAAAFIMAGVKAKPAHSSPAEHHPPAHISGSGPKFSVEAAIKFGWQNFKEHWRALLTILLVMIVLPMLFSLAGNFIPQQGASSIQLLLAAVLSIFIFILGFVFTLGYAKVLLGVADGHKPRLANLFNQYRLLLKYFGAVIVVFVVYALMLALPLLMFVGIRVWGNLSGSSDNLALQIISVLAGVLGVMAVFVFIAMMMVRFIFIPYIIVDKHLGPIAAVKAAWRLTRGSIGSIWLLLFATAILSFLGILAFGVGIIVAGLVGNIAMAYAYRQMTR